MWNTVQFPLAAGFGSTLLAVVPPNLATSELPYSASPPNVCVVTPGSALPKFQTQAPDGAWVPARCWLLFRLQNG